MNTHTGFNWCGRDPSVANPPKDLYWLTIQRQFVNRWTFEKVAGNKLRKRKIKHFKPCRHPVYGLIWEVTIYYRAGNNAGRAQGNSP